MATKGTYAAYAPLRGVGEQIAQNTQHAERMGFHYRREEAEKRQAKRDSDQKLAEQMGVDMSQLTFSETGIQSVDKPQYEYFSNQKKAVGELYERLRDNPDDFEARILLEKKMNSAKLMSGFTQKYADWQTDFKKGIAEGTYSEYLNKGIPDKIHASLKQGRYKILDDKNGDPQLLVDMDGDGEINEIAPINVQEFLGGNELYTPAKATDRFTAMDTIAARFGTVERKEDGQGFTTTEYKGFDPEKTPALYSEVDRLLGTNLESMTNEAKSIMADDMGINPESLTEEGFKEFREEFANGIINKFDKTDNTTTDFGAQNSAASLNYRKQRDAKSDAEEEELPEETGRGITVIANEEGNTVTTSGSTRFLLPKPASVKAGNGQVEIQVMEMKDGKITVSGTQTAGSGTKAETTSFSSSNATQISKFLPQISEAAGLNFETLEDLQNHLKVTQNTQGLPDL